MANKTLAFEIGTEELPAFDLHAATSKLGGLMEGALSDARISFDGVSVFTTPRRLIVIVEGLPEATEESVEEFRGPSAKIAFDADGNPTKAALGFARGKGVDAADLERRDENGTEYVWAVKRNPAQAVADLLPAILTDLITAVPWPKTQRWGSRREQFSRPVRWLLALLDDEVVPVAFAGLESGRSTRGHRFLAPGPHEVASAGELVDVLRAAKVVPSEAEREASIREQVSRIEKETGLVAELPAKTMEEVVNLTEFPTVMVGEFDELFLAVPKEITVDAMLMHQRYFPLFNADGSLSNKFLITSNGDPAFEANIVDGNQRVVAARLYDAKFFYDEDLRRPLEDYVERLDAVVFQEQLGTVRAKTARIEKLAGNLAGQAGLSAQDAADAVRAAHLCKADLVTGAVVEFTSVQGIMGSYYAAAAGETAQVAQAIADHYRPRFAGDELPESAVGKVVAMADKLDTICGLFAVDQGPTGSSDPFALRRAALGIIAILETGLPVSLMDAIDCALASFEADGISFDRAAVRAAVVDFFVTRTRVMLRDSGCEADAIDAVLAVGACEPAEILRRVRALEDARRNAPETFDDLATAYARANNLRDAALGAEVDESLINEVEHALFCAVVQAEGRVARALEADDYRAALSELASLRKPVDLFFERIMVMDEDQALRENRLRLLNRFVAVFQDVADFGKMAKK
ncbi:MAG TPA: glycine--tRNA ligase subunit beta [Candidatus Aphodovivens avistercoris]|nr:glycine--tRNA ligase subunit beta [Candidatus Aphodovivens avistercoris]